MPWMSDGLRHRIKQRKSIFKNEGQSDKWKRLDRSIKKTINCRKSRYTYNADQKKILEEMGKTGQWYTIPKILASDEAPTR